MTTESSSLPPVSLRWMIERNHGYEWSFTQPHIQNASVGLMKHMGFKTFLSSSPAPSVFQTEGWKPGRYYSQKESSREQSTDASLGCKWWDPSLKSHPPSLETFTYKWPPGTLLWIRPHNLVTSYECVMRVSYTPQDLPLVTSKHLFKPHSPLECTRVAHERWTEWGKSFHSNKEVVFPKYFFPPESSAYFSQEGGGLTGNELMALFVFAVQEFRV